MTSVDLTPIIELAERHEAQATEVAELRESLAQVQMMMAYDDNGWLKIAGVLNGTHVEGLTLDELQGIIEKIEPSVVGGSLQKRAVDLHSGFVWGRGCYIEGTEKPKGRGRVPEIRNFFTKRVNQEAVFSDTAREELQKERFITGNVLVVCDTRNRTVNRIPFKQITHVRVDPDFPEKIIAYKRKWNTQSQDGKEDIRERWYYTARYDGPKQKSFSSGGKATPVEADQVVVDLRVNRQVGHVFGVPDALAGLLWAEMYGRIMKYGETVQESLAKILFKVTSRSKNTAQSVGVKLGGFGGHGGTASLLEGQELSAVSTAGRGYDYASGRPVAAMAATAWNVSTMDLLNDSSAAGSSYGSANALVPGNRNAMLLMQREWADFYKTIFEVMGFDRPRVTFEPFEAPDQYRAMQALILGSQTLDDEEFRRAALDILDIVGEASEIPDILKTRTASAKAAVQAASPDQGQSNGTGGGGQGASDQRTDTLSSQESLRREMANEEFLNRFESLIERMENAQK